MSGGSFNYASSNLLTNVFSDYISARYDFESENNKKDRLRAIKENPMHDLELSELIYDIAILLHSCEWYDSGDTGYDTYQADVKAFKKKWFKASRNERIKRDIELVLEDARLKLEETFLENEE